MSRLLENTSRGSNPVDYRLSALHQCSAGSAQLELSAILTEARPVGFEPATFGFEVRNHSAASTISKRPLCRQTPALAESLPNDICKTDPDLAAVVEAWPDLPAALRAGIVAMVKASSL